MTEQLAGIQGVLGTYLTRSEDSPRPVKEQPKRRTTTEAPPPTAKSRKRPSARLGRPPGRGGARTGSKEKATLRIDAELMSDYREWSWDQRCQLGELVERALAEYRRRHR